jgi:hypothetical protein
VRKLAVGALTAGLFAVGAGSAFAASWHGIPTLTTGGAQFTGGKYAFWPSSQNHGGFEWKGKLTDADPDDGHGVYIQVKVSGYDWSRYNGKQKLSVSLDRVNWDGDVLHTDEAQIRVCRDKGSFNPDNCSPTMQYHR